MSKLKMKVIFHGYNTCCQNKAGGVNTRIRKIASLIKERGVDVELFNSFESDVSTCDVLHIFGLNIENYSLIMCAKQQSKRVVMSTVVPITGKWKSLMYKSIRKTPLMTTYKVLYRSLQLTDSIIVESQAEADFLHLIYSVPQSKMVIIPNGVDVDTYTGDEIYEALHKKCDYILQVGRFDENKNQLRVIMAMKNTDIDVVFAGGGGNASQPYYERCLNEAQGCENIHFLGWLPKDSKMLQSAYAHAKMVILPSHYETFGLVALEGGMAGASLAFSNTLPILCYSSFKDCPTFDPDNVVQIKDVLTKAFAQPKDTALRDKLIAEFNWDKIIDEHINLYEKNS